MKKLYSCYICKIKQTKDRFYKNKSRSSGLDSKCKTCRSKLKTKLRARKRKEYGSAYYSPGTAYSSYKRMALKRNIDFKLDKDIFVEWFGKTECHYCGDKISTIGIDRKDNEIGYIKSNIISCCKVCNRFKRAMSYKNFRKQCIKIARNLS